MKPTFYLLFIHLLLILSCKRDFSVSDNYEIQLTLESAEVVETWLKLMVSPLDTESAYTVKRDTQTVFSGNLIKTDTLLHDVNMQPNTNYVYKVFKNESIVNNAKLEVTTMDTTSHNFTWQSFEFGDHSSSYFSDVAIVGEEVWAVGKVYTDSGDFNVAHWNGSKWILKKVKVRLEYTSSVYYTENDPVNTVFIPEKNDIWFVSRAGGVTRYKDNEKLMMEIPYGHGPGSANKIWGSSSDDMYFVGSSGNITHFNGQTWQKLNGGTEIDIQDIWGYSDQQAGEDFILCTVSEKYSTSEDKLLQITQKNLIKEFNWPFSDKTPYSVWFKDRHNIFIAGDGVRVKNRLGTWNTLHGLPRYFKNSIRGNNINDIMIAGEFLLLAHFNGINWKEYTVPQSGKFYSIDYKNNYAVAVGRIEARALIMMKN